MTDVMALPRGALTRDDLESMPDDGHRYELVDGTLLVSPAPGLAHQLAALRMWQLIDEARASDQLAITAPFDVVLSHTTVFQPDVLLAPRTAFTQRQLDGPPTLAVEVLSPPVVRLPLPRAMLDPATPLMLPTVWVTPFTSSAAPEAVSESAVLVGSTFVCPTPFHLRMR